MCASPGQSLAGATRSLLKSNILRKDSNPQILNTVIIFIFAISHEIHGLHPRPQGWGKDRQWKRRSDRRLPQGGSKETRRIAGCRKTPKKKKKQDEEEEDDHDPPARVPCLRHI